ncbi:MAG: AMP-binding protein, partial [Vampirovibrionia bacterium]
MNMINNYRELELNFFAAVLSLMFLAASLVSFSYFLFFTANFLLTLISLITLSIMALILVFNKNMVHFVLRPVAVLLLKVFCRIEVEGQNNLPEDGAYILAGNHTGLIDSIIVSVACKRPVNFIMTNEVFSWPIAGSIVGLFNVIPVFPKKGIQAINKGVELLRKGKVLAIFPEGRCTEDGNLNKFHRGVARMHRLTEAPIVPFAIYGGFEAWPIAGIPKPHKVKIILGKPQVYTGLKENEIIESLQDKVRYMKTSLDRHFDKAKYNAYQDKVLSLLQSKSDKYVSNLCLSSKLDDNWSELTYGELSRKASNFSNKLVKDGINYNDRLAILSESSIYWAVSFFAGVRSGSIVVPLDIKLTESELTNILSDCQPSVLCVSSSYEDIALSLKERLNFIKHIYVIDKDFENYEKALPVDPITSRNADETALIVYTSGTTGSPKGVMITFDNLISQLDGIQKVFNVNSKDTFLSMLPL